MPITPEGQALGHYYDSSRMNSPCGKCESDHYAETGEFVLFLDCRYDDGDDTEYCETDIGQNAMCGEPAIGYRDGFPVCQLHADRFDWAAAHQED